MQANTKTPRTAGLTKILLIAIMTVLWFTAVAAIFSLNHKASAAGTGISVNGGVEQTSAENVKTAIDESLASGDASVTGKLTGITTPLAIEIPAGKTLTWNAVYSGASGSNATALVTLSGGGIFNMTGGKIISTARTALQIDGSVTATVSGGEITALGDTNAIPVSRGIILAIGFSGTLNIAGGTVRADTANGRAILAQGAAATVNVTGGQIVSVNDTGIHFDNSNASLNITGGLVFGGGTAAVHKTGFAEPSGVGIAITWTKQAWYTEGTSTDLAILPAGASAVWEKQADVSGIAYQNGASSGFLALPVTVMPPRSAFAPVTPMAISGGAIHSLALDEGGNVWAWGANNYGQIGNGASGNNVVSPTQVNALGVKYTAISAGYDHSLTLDEGGNVWAWGKNDFGQIGNGASGNNVVSATQVTYANAGGVKYTAISAGSEHSLALDETGNIWAWGNNYSGQIGNGTSVNKVVSPRQVTDVDAGGAKYTAIAAGGNHSLALDEGGNIWAWGQSDYGQIGNGESGGNVVSPTQVTYANAGGVKYTAIAAGRLHNLALDETGNIWAWGYNYSGQIGNGTMGNNTNIAVPTKVTNVGANGVRYTAISAGNSHSLALNEAGNIWAWGHNDNGQIGNGASGNYVVNPTQVVKVGVNGVRYTAISAGRYHSFALDERENLLAWGYNQYGQIGNGTSGSNVFDYYLHERTHITTAQPLTGITAPASGAAVNTDIKGGTGFFASLMWLPNPESTYKPDTVYTALIALNATWPYEFSSLNTAAAISGFVPAGASAPVVISADSRAIVFTIDFPKTAVLTAPIITDGQAAMTLTEGYTATSTSEFTISGGGTVDVEKINGDDKITWNDIEKRLDIAAGLSPGTYIVTLKASNGTYPDAFFTFTLTVNPPAVAGSPVILTGSLDGCEVGVSYNKQLAASGGGLTWSIQSGKLSDGLTLLSDGTLSGTPLSGGTFTFTVKVINEHGSDTKALSITVTNNTPTQVAPSITGETSKTLDFGYEATSTNAYTIGGDTPITVTKINGDAKITWNDATKKLDIAADLAAGTYVVTLKATNGVSPDAIFTFTLTVNKANGAAVNDAPVKALATTNSITVSAVTAPANGQTVEYAISTAITTPVNGWQTGLTFYGLNAGTTYYVFARSAGNGNYNAGTATVSAAITTNESGAVIPPSITTNTLDDGVAGESYAQTLTASGDLPITWQIFYGDLPYGLQLIDNQISGTPLIAGYYEFVVMALSGAGSDIKVLSIYVDYDPDDISQAFSDDIFRNHIYSLIGKVNGSAIYYDDVKDIVSLDIRSLGISSLDGLEYFTSLETLDCSYNDLSWLDLTGFTSLKELECIYNNNLAGLDLTGCTSLETVYCGNNNLSWLDLTGCIALKELYCFDNSLTSLDLTDCTSLVSLYCYANSLTSLDLTGCTSLETVFCDNNNLSRIDLTGCVALKELYCFDNSLTSLDLTDCTSLEGLYCSGNELTYLILTGLNNLISINCSSNNFASELDVIGFYGNWDDIDFIFYPQNPLTIAPGITGETTKTLDLGYTATSTSEFTIEGSGTVTVEKIYGNALISWNSTTRTLDIAAGLEAGTYTVVLKVSSDITDATEILTFTLTVEATPVIPPAAPSITDGQSTMTITEGYSVTSTDAFIIVGDGTVTVVKVNGDSKITWNDTTKKLDIAAGLSAGTYAVTLKASNGTYPDALFTFTLTVGAATVTPPTPRVGDNGNVWIGDTDTGIKADSGTAPTVTIGTNGNLFVDGADTGIKADTDDSKKGLSAGAAAGIAVAATAVATLGGFAIYWFVVRKRSLADLFGKK